MPFEKMPSVPPPPPPLKKTGGDVGSTAFSEQVPAAKENPAPKETAVAETAQKNEEVKKTPEEGTKDSFSRGTLVLDGKGYAVGLMWQPLQDPDNPMPEIKDMLESDDKFNLYCIRLGAASQYAVGRSESGHMAGEPVAAAAVAMALSDKSSVCAVFKVAEGWWFVAIRNDLILSEEDVLFEKEVDAQKAFFSMMAVPDWDIKIAPKEWKIDDTTELDLLSLIKDVRKIRLQELHGFKKSQTLLIMAVLLVAFIGLIVYGLIKLYDTITQKPVELAPVQAPVVFMPVEPVPEKPKPWENVVDINAFLNRCYNNAYQLSVIYIPGWTIGNITCTKEGITTQFSKTVPSARTAMFKVALDNYKLVKARMSLDATGKMISVNVPFNNDLPLVRSVPTLNASKLEYELIDIVAATGIPITFSKQTQLDPPNLPDGSVPPNQQQLTFFTFSITSPYTPWEWKPFFDKLTGLDLIKIEYNPAVEATTKWKYEGKIYVQE